MSRLWNACACLHIIYKKFFSPAVMFVSCPCHITFHFSLYSFFIHAHTLYIKQLALRHKGYNLCKDGKITQFVELRYFSGSHSTAVPVFTAAPGMHPSPHSIGYGFRLSSLVDTAERVAVGVQFIRKLPTWFAFLRFSFLQCHVCTRNCGLQL